MTRALGSGCAIKYCEEAAWGTTPALPSIVYGMNFKSETMGMTKNIFQSEMINSYRAVIGLGDGNKAVQGNIVSDLLPEGMEVLWKHLLGNPTPVTTGSGIYTHVMKGAAGYAEGLSIEKGFSNITTYFLYSGCRMNSVSINLVQEGFHEVTWDFIGKEETIDEAATQIVGTAVNQTENGYTGYQCTLSVKAAGVGAYSDISNVVTGSMSITNNIETDGYVLGSAYRASAIYGRREISGDFSVFFEDVDLYNTYFTTGTEIALKFTFDDTLGNLLVIEFHRCKLGGESPQVSDQGGLNIPFTFQARIDDTEETDVTVTITNTIASF